MGLYELTERLEHEKRLDGLVKSIQQVVGKVIPPGPFKDLLTGTWLGHPLHPALVAVPIGAWAGAAVLDLTGGVAGRKAADRLVGFGILSALPTAATGAADWGDTVGGEARVGVVHALGNAAALGLMVASWRARRRGKRIKGVGLAMGANGLMVATGYLGGHLAYSQGVGVDHTVFESGPTSWTPVADTADLREGEPHAVDVADGVTLLLVRDRGRIHALSARCTHRGGPLQEGEIADGCVTCPWHGSVFRLTDGSIVRGPATQPQPPYDTRVVDNRVEVRRRELRGDALLV